MEKNRIAIHEAGHLAVCYHLGWMIKKIIKTKNSPYSICYEKDGVEYYSNPTTEVQRNHNFERICIAWGGGIMEESEFGDLWISDGKKSVHEDEKTVKKLLSYNKDGIEDSQKAFRKSEMILEKKRTLFLKIAKVVLHFLNNPYDFEKHKEELNRRFNSN